MAIYRTVRMTFWTDSKVVDDFTPEDRYFYLYLMTNPHTNLAGCYEISMKQASDETGYNKEVIENLLDRFEKVHEVIRYSTKTKEVLILNWSKFNWTKSEAFRKPLLKEIEEVKCLEFMDFLQGLYNGEETVPIPSPDGVGTTVSVSVTDTVTVKNKGKGGMGGKPIPKKKDPYEDLPENLTEALKEFEQMRKSIKKPLTDRARKMLLSNLDKLAGDDVDKKIAILDQSTFHNWQDVYPIKQTSDKRDSDFAKEAEDLLGEFF